MTFVILAYPGIINRWVQYRGSSGSFDAGSFFLLGWQDFGNALGEGFSKIISLLKKRMDKIKVLFVCLGNICRSPSAEAVFRAQVEREGLSDYVEIDSAGILGYHAGEPSDGRMQKHAVKRGYRLTSISRKVNAEVDFGYFDMIIGMDDQNIEDLRRLASNAGQLQKIFKMTDFCKDCAYEEVPDPYYGGDAGFELVLDLLEESCKGLLSVVKNRS